MSSMMMMDRGMMNPMGTMGSSMPAPSMSMPSMGACMVPRCTMKMEKCSGGMKIHCKCDDEMSCAMLQNMVRMMCEGMCSCCAMMNGMVMCQCNMAMCTCKCDMTKDGCTITCTSGDKACCEMVQACCDCMTKCMEAGCSCCVCFNNMPCCCGKC
ncbi:MAG: hypothetical protein HYX69_10575 [Planctomycetia bacterium]|nr:hypothetical protein [Planctomycetia bacterium]